jgi:hypothetical protein
MRGFLPPFLRDPTPQFHRATLTLTESSEENSTLPTFTANATTQTEA